MNELKERPILFNTEMVNAVLEGRKTQTRRAVKKIGNDHPWEVLKSYVAKWLNPNKCDAWFLKHTIAENPNADTFLVKCPYGKVGDRLWVRETFAEIHFQKNNDDLEFPTPEISILYKANSSDVDKKEKLGAKWKPSIFMPRWASRIKLEITNIRVERLNDISEDDARCEGVESIKGGFYKNYFDSKQWGGLQVSARASFASLWNAINGLGSWKENPWVWVVEFKRVN